MLTERQLVEIEVRAKGAAAIAEYRMEATRHEALGDTERRDVYLRRIQIAEAYLAEQAAQQAALASIRPNDVDLFAGIAGATMRPDSFDLGGGVAIRKTYAHVMAPFLVAFERATLGQPHPAPWKAVSGGIAFDVEMELVLPRNVRPTGFDRLNTIWWLVALLRLQHPCGLRVPTISTMSFSEIVASSREPKFWPVQMSEEGTAIVHSQEVPTSALEWVRDNYVAGEILMRDQAFSSAFQAFDGSFFSGTSSSAKLFLWAALEALFRPGRQRITHRLAAVIATHLHVEQSERDRRYQQVKSLYEARGQIAHAAEVPQADDVRETFLLAQACFIKTIEDEALPDAEALLSEWATRSD